MLETVTYAGVDTGPKLLVLGAVHGDEKCGTRAIKRVMMEIDSGALKIGKGQVTFIPVCNPRAYEQNVRFIDRNLNRYLVPVEKPVKYEEKIGNELLKHLAVCDVVLDIHSSPCGDKPFLFCEPVNPAELAFAASLGPDWVIKGWDDAFPGQNSDEATGTETAVRNRGGIAALIECGNHNEPTADEVAYRAIRNALAYWGLSGEEKPRPRPLHVLTVLNVFYRTDEGRYAQPWRDFDAVKAGQEIATRSDGEILRAPSDGFIILPMPDNPIGTEWFYFGVEE